MTKLAYSAQELVCLVQRRGKEGRIGIFILTMFGSRERRGGEITLYLFGTGLSIACYSGAIAL